MASRWRFTTGMWQQQAVQPRCSCIFALDYVEFEHLRCPSARKPRICPLAISHLQVQISKPATSVKNNVNLSCPHLKQVGAVAMPHAHGDDRSSPPLCSIQQICQDFEQRHFGNQLTTICKGFFTSNCTATKRVSCTPLACAVQGGGGFLGQLDLGHPLSHTEKSGSLQNYPYHDARRTVRTSVFALRLASHKERGK